MQHQIDSRFAAVENYINVACTSQATEEFKSYLYRFGTVLLCGNIERCVEIIVLERLSYRAHPRVLSFIKSHFKRGNNFDCEAISQLLSRFEPAWANAFTKYLTDNNDVAEGISSLYAVRNSVAHGGQGSVGSSRLQELLTVSKKLVNALVIATQ